MIVKVVVVDVSVVEDTTAACVAGVPSALSTAVLKRPFQPPYRPRAIRYIHMQPDTVINDDQHQSGAANNSLKSCPVIIILTTTLRPCSWMGALLQLAACTARGTNDYYALRVCVCPSTGSRSVHSQTRRCSDVTMSTRDVLSHACESGHPHACASTSKLKLKAYNNITREEPAAIMESGSSHYTSRYIRAVNDYDRALVI